VNIGIIRSVLVVAPSVLVLLGCGPKGEKSSGAPAPAAADVKADGAFVRVTRPTAALRFKGEDKAPVIASAQEGDVFQLESKEREYYAVKAVSAILWIRVNEVVRVANGPKPPSDPNWWRAGCSALRDASTKSEHWMDLGESESRRLAEELYTYGADKEQWKGEIRTHHAIEAFHRLGINPALTDEIKRLCLERSGLP